MLTEIYVADRFNNRSKKMHAHNKEHPILWEGSGQFMKIVLMSNIATTTWIEKLNAHTQQQQQQHQQQQQQQK